MISKFSNTASMGKRLGIDRKSTNFLETIGEIARLGLQLVTEAHSPGIIKRGIEKVVVSVVSSSRKKLKLNYTKN